MADTCAKCGRARYPDSFRFCGRCERQSHLAIEVVKSPQDYADDAQPVGTDRMTVGETILWLGIGCVVFLFFGWALGEEVPR